MKYFTLKISVLISALMFVLPAFSQITLQYNLKKGEIFKQNMVTNMDIVQKIMDQEMKINLTVGMKATFEVKAVNGDSYTLEMKYKEIKMSTTMPGMGNLSFDSNTPENIATQLNMGPMLKAIIDKPVESVITKTGKVESVKGFEKIKEAMFNSLDRSMPEQTKQMMVAQLGSQYSEESFKAFFAQNLSYFPEKPINTGNSWDVKITSTISNFSMNINTKMTLRSIEGNVVVLDMDGIVSTPEEAEQEMNEIKAKVSLKGIQKGTIKVNKNNGWIISSEITHKFNGDIESMGMKVPIFATTTTSITED
ncbi:MAG: DUF6263 family protein [Prevotellaceae bacterium]|jgi:hypothetical protein|nr:DUF6263 family protein [Prevotellaceae bacterium]